MIVENLIQTFEESFKNNWDVPAFENYNEESFTYGEIADKITWFHDFFERAHIKIGDKIALVGKNSVNWAITYLASISYGAVIVPILPDFNSKDIQHLVNHSDSILLFSSESIFEDLDETEMHNLTAVFSLKDFSLLFSRKKHLKEVIRKKKIKELIKEKQIEEIIKNISIEDIIEKTDENYLEKYDGVLSSEVFSFPKIENNEVAAIVYTSGTTGFSKGVILTHNNLIANVVAAEAQMPLDPGDRILSFLPLAHSFGCTCDLLFSLSQGCHITFLGKIPSPKIIIKAFADVKPRLIFSVPLVMEKIYKKQIKPEIQKFAIKFARKIGPIRKLINKKICKKLTTVFGGNFKEIVLGGAALSKEVEEFFQEIGLRFTIGYGMTECAPLISYTGYKTHKPEGVGKAIQYTKVKIDSKDPQNVVGEILIRGENVMTGYYKNEEATKNTIDENGWLHSGDLGIMDKDGFVFIKGRSKSMILGPSGQNIYPEEIESRLNNLPYVGESLILEKDGKIHALIYPDYDIIDKKNLTDEQVQKKMEENRKFLNEQLPAYSKIIKINLYPEEFEKTPTKKVKRFLYEI